MKVKKVSEAGVNIDIVVRVNMISNIIINEGRKKVKIGSIVKVHGNIVKGGYGGGAGYMLLLGRLRGCKVLL